MIFYFAFSVFFCLVFVLNALGRLTEGIVIDLLENHEINWLLFTFDTLD